jgi:hypothetical protein
MNKTNLNKSIIAALIAEVVAALPLEKVVKKVTKMAGKIHEGKIPGDAAICAMYTVSDLQEAGEFWNDFVMVNNLVASYLENVTMEIANPVLRSMKGVTHADINEIVTATDDLQVQAVPLVIARCQEKYGRLEIVRQADNPVQPWSVSFSL